MPNSLHLQMGLICTYIFQSFVYSVLLRIKHHVEPKGLHMAEQILRKSGEMSSAKDLTWNYADVLKAVHARDEYVKTISTAAEQGTVVVV